MKIKMLLLAMSTSIANTALAAETVPKVACMLSRTIDIQKGSHIRIISKGTLEPVIQPGDRDKLLYPSIYLRVDPNWVDNRITLEEQERSTQLQTDAEAVGKKILSELQSKSSGDFTNLTVPSQQPTEVPEEGTNCIQYVPSLALTTVEIGHREVDIRKPDSTFIIYGPEENFFLPVALTFTKIRNEKYDTTTQQTTYNDKFSILAGLGYKLGDFYTKYSSGGNEDWNWEGNVSISALVRLKLGSRTWGGGPAVSYRLADEGRLRYVDCYLGAIWAKGDGPGTKGRTSFTLGLMAPISLVTGSLP